MEEPVEYNAGKKEELICIAKMIDKGEDKDLKHFKIYSRQEAIERMARAICLCDDDGGCKGVCNPKCDVWKYSLKHAEAALEALLCSK